MRGNGMIQKIKEFIDKIKFYALILGGLCLLGAMINLFSHSVEKAKAGFLFCGGAVVLYGLLELLYRVLPEPKPQPAPVMSSMPPVPAVASTKVLGLVVMLERPLRFSGDQQALVQSILQQQRKEFHRMVSDSVPMQISVAGTDLEDEAYVYARCRIFFEPLDTWKNNTEFLSRVAVGSFMASDGNRGRHFSFLDRSINPRKID
jgi:hypothetical protein